MRNSIAITLGAAGLVAVFSGPALAGSAPATVTPRGMCPTEDSCTVSYAHGQWRITATPPPQPARRHVLPLWVRWHRVNDGGPCIMVYPRRGDTSALVCKSGRVDTS